VVLQNGKPVRVVAPGGRIWRGFRAPVIGSLYVVPINRGTVAVEQVVRDVVTRRDGYVAESVPLSLRVRLDTADDYARLKRFLQDRGESFADDLLAELRNGVDELVRRTFAERTHDDLYGASVAGFLKPGREPVPIAGGLMIVESLTVSGRVEWSSVFLAIRKVEGDLALAVQG
jgi:hypothetical protein